MSPFALIIQAILAPGDPFGADALAVIRDAAFAYPVDGVSSPIMVYASEIVGLVGATPYSARVSLLRNDERQVWLDYRQLIFADDFSPLTAWAGPPVVEIFSASYDSGQRYTMFDNGIFSAAYDDNHDPRVWWGRLHLSGSVVWSRESGVDRVDSWSLFQLRASGEVCWLFFDSGSGECECIETEAVTHRCG